MPANVGTVDQYVRIVVTAFFKSCSVYSVLGISTGERRINRT
jgi:hypothetical protein